VVILGNGGHARACLDAWGPQDLVPVGYVAPETGDVLGLDHLGDDRSLAGLVERGIDGAFVALGDNDVRRVATDRCSAAGLALVTVIAPSAQIGATARLGEGAVVMHGAIVGANASIGRGAIVNTGASVDHDCVIGDFVHIAPGARLAGTVTVATGAMVGVGACVIQGITIGEGATVGAGAVVVRDVAPGATVVSVAARELDPRT
jgi:UDP-perosamine 4-acetyltransferase